MPEEDNDNTNPADATGSDPLSGWQRAAASTVGAVSAGAGGVSVFMTTNQAGSLALLTVGAAFLLMAVSGAPIIKVKLKDNEVTLGSRRKRVLERVKIEPPDDALHTLDILQQLDPGSRDDPEVQRAYTRLYEAEVIAALARIAARYPELQIIQQQSRDLGPDITIRSREGIGIDVELKFSAEPNSFSLTSSYLEKVYEAATNRIFSLLIITNGRLSNVIGQMAERYDPDGAKIQFVRWSDRQDDRALELGVTRLLRLRERQD